MCLHIVRLHSFCCGGLINKKSVINFFVVFFSTIKKRNVQVARETREV